MKIKVNEKHVADWRFINCSANLDLYKGESLFMKVSIKRGYRFNVIMLDGHYYVTQALFDPSQNYESISVHTTTSVNDAKAIIKAMVQFIDNYREMQPVVEEEEDEEPTIDA